MLNKLFKNHLNGTVSALLGLALYTTSFSFYGSVGPSVQISGLLPILLIGWYFGSWIGGAAALLLYPYSLLILSLNGFEISGLEFAVIIPIQIVLLIGAYFSGLISSNLKISNNRNEDQALKIDVLEDEIRKRRVLESELLQSESRYRKMVEEAGDVVYITDIHGYFEYINQPGVRFIGYTLGELSKKRFSELLPPAWREEVEEFFKEQIRQGKRETLYEFPIITRRGEMRWVEQVTNILVDGGRITGLQGFLRDVTRRKQTEEALAVARDQALEVNLLKSKLLATITHDVRTPLSALLGYIDLLHTEAYGALNENQKDILVKVKSITGQINQMTNNLLNQSEIEGGELTIHREVFHLSELVSRVKEVVAILADHKGLDLIVDVDPQMPENLYADFQRLQRIIINLVNNAIKFTETGSVTIRISKMIHSQWMIEVIDTGPGIPAEAQEEIFEPFKQVEGSNTKNFSGTGLGLFIVREFANLMNGQVELVSQLGEGSTFRVILPIVQLEEKKVT